MVLRCWDPIDAELYRDALAVSRTELQRWIPWVLDGSSDLTALEARLAGYREDFFEGRDALYAIVDPPGRQVLGGAGLYRRVGPGALEIGYWVRSDRAGEGLATVATAVLTEAGLTLPGIERIEIHCDPRNRASFAIPRKLGYNLRETRLGAFVAQAGECRDTMVWEIDPLSVG